MGHLSHPTLSEITSAESQFHVPTELSNFQITIPDYYAANPSVDALIVGAVVFHGNRTLIIQRAVSDFAGSMWEVPGGSCESGKDATVIHAVQRELLEETGLHLRSVKQLIGQEDIKDGYKANFTWRKLTFEIEIHEIFGLKSGKPNFDKPNSESDVAVVVNPREHQDWGWATKDEILNRKWNKGSLQFLENQRMTILKAFEATG